MTASADDLAAAAACDFARTLSAKWQSQLAGEVIGVYLIGSLAHGGFSRRYSDIDLALITERGLDQAVFQGLRAQALALSSELGPKVSVFSPTAASTVAASRRSTGPTISIMRCR